MTNLRLPILFTFGLLGCGMIPHQAEFITERKALASANLEANGILAFEVANDTGMDVQVDFIHRESDKKYRVDLTPVFSNSVGLFIGPFQVAEKKLAKDVVSDTVALFQLPAGSYSPWYMYVKAEGQNQTGFKAVGGPFEIFPGQITSVGRLQISADKNLIFLSNLRIQSGSDSIDAGIRGVESPSVSTRKIVSAYLRITMK